MKIETDPPSAAERDPCWRLPPGATDSHFHVFGPETRYPYQPTRDYTPEEAPPSRAAAIFARMGIERAVLAQASVYGQDNERHLSAAQELGLPARVVVCVPDDLDEAAMAALDRRGARAVRLITLRRPLPARDALASLSARLAERGWHLQIQPRADQLPDLAEAAALLSCDLVIDHLGMVDPAGGAEQPAVAALAALLGSGRGWVKISGFYRLSRLGAPYDDIGPIVRRLAEAGPDRLLWGSDWPHPFFAGPVPAYADLLDPLADWIPDAAARDRVMADNPARLFGF